MTENYMNKVDKIVEAAQDQFWAEVAEQCPEIMSGGFPPDADFEFNKHCERAVRTWISANTMEAPCCGREDCEWYFHQEPDHNCRHFVVAAVWAQMENLEPEERREILEEALSEWDEEE